MEFKKKIEYIMGIGMLFIFAFSVLFFNGNVKSVFVVDADKEKRANGVGDKVIVIDPGHGGYDPGKIGINGELEKDINLEISLKLKELLEKQGFTVIMTRTTDESLCSEDVKSKKASDMAKRIEIVNEANPELMISIHQNSYTSESVKGAQVFYYSGSEEGKRFAEELQEIIKVRVDENNKRMAKENDSYYVLLRVKCPAVIVECGFLSNWEEATKLCDDVYQEKMASAICDGIVNYFK